MSTVTAVPLQPVKRGYLLWLWIGIVAALVGGAALALATPQIKLVTLTAGKGPHPTNSDVVLVNYEGRLADGTIFDKSQAPTPFPVAGVVPGFSQGLKLMAKGGKYRLTVPPELGYGAKAAGPIPANATLIFTVELIDFIPAEVLRQMQAQQSMRGGGMPGAMPGQVPQGPPPAP